MRNGSGSYTLPDNTWNPAVPSTTILAEDWNQTASDLSLAITQSLASDGQTTTTAAIPFAQGVRISVGTEALPSLSVIGDINTGFYAPAADQIAMVAGGVTALIATGGGLTLPLGLTVLDNVTINGTTTLNGNVALGDGSGDAITVNGVVTFVEAIASATITALTVGTSIVLPNNVITNAALSNMATQTIKGRTTAGSGAPEDLTATQATAIMNPMVGDSGSGGTKGLVPAPAAGNAASKFYLGADGLWSNEVIAQGIFTVATGVAIRSRNISMVRNSAGSYTFTLSPAAPTTGYMVFFGYSGLDQLVIYLNNTTKTTTVFTVTSSNLAAVNTDATEIYVEVRY